MHLDIQLDYQYLNKLYMACRTCYAEIITLEEVESKPDQEKWKLVHQVLGSGHYSIAEHANITIKVSGISLVIIQQLIRHRIASYSQRSSRYVTIKDFKFTTPHTIKSGTVAEKKFNRAMRNAVHMYEELIDNGIPKEDARYVLPTGMHSEIMFTLNLRSLFEISHKRLCTRAQNEIRILFNNIRLIIEKEEPELSKYIVPNCEYLGFCPEHKSCGRKL